MKITDRYLQEKPLWWFHLFQSAYKAINTFLSGVGKYLPTSFKQTIKQNRILRAIFFISYTPSRTQRVFLKKNINHLSFFADLNERKIEYVLLRWWEQLPYYPDNEDINILVRDEHREMIQDLYTVQDNGNIKCDIYTVNGSNNGSRKNVPVFPNYLSVALLSGKRYFNGAFVPSPKAYFASVAYHAIYHKGMDSGVVGFNSDRGKFSYDYSSSLKQMAEDLGIEVEITVRGLVDWLKKENYAPAEDTLTKLVEQKPELWILQTPLSSDVRGGELMVFMVRERLVEDGLLNDFKLFLEKEWKFDVLDVHELNPEEKILCTSQIRGGKWDNGPFKYSGGPPVAMVVVYDYHPQPLPKEEQKKQTRMTNKNNVEAKYAFRDRIRKLVQKRSDYNGLHSADNEPDAQFYISFLGRKYSEKIALEVEKRRKRYSHNWSVREKLSENALSKVEVIKYREGLAVKKTFRPGKEKYFDRELYAVKQLSRQLHYIPPLLEEGDGFFVVPYFPNVLKTVSQKEKERLIFSKRMEILNVISDLHSRSLAFIGFSPQSLIITPGNKLYCSGFSYLQQYGFLKPEINNAFEVKGIPEDFRGDIPGEMNLSSSTFNEIWEPLLGSWEGLRAQC